MKNISVKKFSQEGWRILKGIPFLYFLKQKRQTLNFNGKKKKSDRCNGSIFLPAIDRNIKVL